MAQLPPTLSRIREFVREEYSRTFRHDHWNVGIADVPIAAFLDSDSEVPVRWLPRPGSGKYYADPFGLARRSGAEIFFEEYDFQTDKGVISHVRELDGMGFTAPQVALDLPVHTSYPFLWEHGGSVYCIPETSKAREIALYKAEEFPGGWTKAAVLVPGVAGVDPTLLEHDGRLWLFCTDLDRGPFSDLRIWYARDLLGAWSPHPGNPVKTDLHSARPGGTPFRAGGELYRPAQDCSSTYGGSLTINRVVRLTPEEFREEPVAVVRPFQDGPLTRGIHTLSALGPRTLVDGKRVGFNSSEMARALRESLEDRWPRAIRRSMRSSDALSPVPPVASRGG